MKTKRMSRRIIEQATRERVREVLAAELNTLADFTYSVTRKSIDLTDKKGKRQVVVSGFSDYRDWAIVELEVKRIYKRLTGNEL